MTSLGAICLGPATQTDEHSTEERAQSSERLRELCSVGRTRLRGSHPKVGKNLRKIWKYLELEIPKQGLMQINSILKVDFG